MLSFAKGVRMKRNEPKRLGQILVFLAHHCHDGSQCRSSGSCNAVKVWHERLTCLGIEAKQQPTANLETHFRCVQYIIKSGGLFTHASGKTWTLYYHFSYLTVEYWNILKSKSQCCVLLCLLIGMYVLGLFTCKLCGIKRGSKMASGEMARW